MASVRYRLFCGLNIFHLPKKVQAASGRQLIIYSTTCVRCWVRKMKVCAAAAAMTSLFQSCGAI